MTFFDGAYHSLRRLTMAPSSSHVSIAIRMTIHLFIQLFYTTASYMTDFLSDEAVKLIHTHAATPNANPFFITMAYNAPHNPLQALDTDYYDPELSHISDHNERVYAAMIKALDRGVGKLLESLRSTNQWENTIVMFTSDNGGASYIDIPHINYPYRGWKATFFEGGIRVPLYMQWPAKVDKSITVTESVSHVDIFPTVFAAISQEADAHPANAKESKQTPRSTSTSNDLKLENAQLLMYRYENMRTMADKVFAFVASMFSTLSRSVYYEKAKSSKIINMNIPTAGDIRPSRNIEPHWAQLNTSKPQSFYIRRERPRSPHALDGVNLLPLVTRQATDSGASNDCTERVLYWRSGDYKAIVFAKWFDTLLDHISIRFINRVFFIRKLQVSQQPKKIWFFNLREDPTEKVNIAELIGIRNEDDLNTLSGVEDLNADVIKADVAWKKERLLEMYQLLLNVDSQQRKPIWPALVEFPLRIDSTSNALEIDEEEYIYWSN